MPPSGVKRKRDRAALEELEDPDVQDDSEGLPCLQCFKLAIDQTWTAIKLGREEEANLRESLPEIKCSYPSMDNKKCSSCLLNKSSGCSGPPAMIAGNYLDLILTIDLVKDVLKKIQDDQPEIVESRRGIVKAVCQLGLFFWSTMNQHRSHQGLHYPVGAGQAHRSQYNTLVSNRNGSAAGEDKLLRIGLADHEHAKLNDVCRQFITTFTKYLKKAGVEDAEVQRRVDLAPVKPLDRRNMSANMSLGSQN